MKQTLATAIAGFLMAGTAMLTAAEPTLKPGDPAPKLQSGKWIQGEPVKEFQKGKAYLVEFWATWCGPCVATIPHMNELHQKFADKGLVVIGQNVWERDESKVEPFVKKMGSKMTYRVALDDKSTEEDGAMAIHWMKAAGQNGIPAAFLVNKEGKIAWIGHPGTLNEKTVEQVLAGTFDTAKAAADAAKEKENMEQISGLSRKLSEQMKGKNWDEAEKTLEEIVGLLPESMRGAADFMRMQIQMGKGEYAAAATSAERLTKDVDEPRALNQIAWMLLTSKDAAKPEMVASAHRIASRANETAKGTNSAVLDTLARATWMKGDQKQAIELEEKALSVAEEENKTKLQETLDSYKAGKLPEVPSQE